MEIRFSPAALSHSSAATELGSPGKHAGGEWGRGVKDILVNSRRAHRRSKAGQEKEKEVLGAVRWVYVWQMWPEKWPPGSR